MLPLEPLLPLRPPRHPSSTAEAHRIGAGVAAASAASAVVEGSYRSGARDTVREIAKPKDNAVPGRSGQLTAAEDGLKIEQHSQKGSFPDHPGESEEHRECNNRNCHV